MPKTRKKFRILALDGGPAGVTYARMIKQICQDLGEEGKDFFRRVDMIAGNSFGAVLGTYLAIQLEKNHEDETALHDGWIQFAEDALASLAPENPQILLRTIAGDHASYETEDYKNLLIDTYEGYNFQELQTKLCYLAYQFQAPSHPIVYRNYGTDGTEKADMDVSDVVLRSSAYPICMPVQAGFTDGFVISNNPSMAALTQLIQQSRSSDDPRLQDLQLDDIVLLSLGADEYNIGNYLGSLNTEGEDSWGWKNWIGLNLKKMKEEAIDTRDLKKLSKEYSEENREILTYFSLLLTGSAQAVALQCSQLLPNQQSLRLAPQPKKGIGRQFALQYIGKYKVLVEDAIERTQEWCDAPDDEETFKPTYHQTKAWLRQHWFQDEIN
ncbi:MAG: hypothetical protein CL920_24970 [Deltaproteobacteria bacterium]|nr:hypothetical protein [Deltaproteobacteria bacterium]MBU51957.1 hypothetical protein [Deltaproteobacteria bacterium]